jgi:hypothetical protein
MVLYLKTSWCSILVSFLEFFSIGSVAFQSDFVTGVDHTIHDGLGDNRVLEEFEPSQARPKLFPSSNRCQDGFACPAEHQALKSGDGMVPVAMAVGVRGLNFPVS